MRQVALVVGATHGAGRAIAVELARSGVHVCATGRSSRTRGRSEIGRPETVEETADLAETTGGSATAVVVDHEDPAGLAALGEHARARRRPRGELARRARRGARLRDQRLADVRRAGRGGPGDGRRREQVGGTDRDLPPARGHLRRDRRRRVEARLPGVFIDTDGIGEQTGKDVESFR